MSIPSDYVERVYAGVLGKIIGVYLGRPFEGWTYDRIMAELGEINYYVHEKRGVPLIVTDDDISGTFTFLRALPDHGNRGDITPAQIGQSWLNYIIEKRTILWWGGLGNSTEHTAYLRLKHGIPAPQSGSIQTNGKIVAEQIGAQIFIDGWAMVAPGDPKLAAELARKAGSVSHDGEAVYGAQVLAAMEAQAFVESDTNKLLDVGVSIIPKDSIIYRLIADLREWRVKEPDWRKAREMVVERYGYDQYIGNCHMVPNHALIILGFLYGDDDFQRSLMIVNTCGWDTDCNSGNLGCLMGIKNGLAGIDAGPDWRTPVADRLYVAAADGGRVVSDAVIETYHIVNSGLALAGKPPKAPKGGARFHFELPGSVQGFHTSEGRVGNVVGHSQKGSRSLALVSQGEARFSTPTFLPQEALNMQGYGLMASPTIYSGQKLRAGLSADAEIRASLYLGVFDANDKFAVISGPKIALSPGKYSEVEWMIPDTHGAPVAEVGVDINGKATLYLDYLTWDGTPTVTFSRPVKSELPWPGPMLWRRAWMDGMETWESRWREPFRLVQNEGRGLISQGTREWKDYRASTKITPTLVSSAGLGVRVQGMRRFYALLLCAGGKVRLIKALEGDHILAEADLAWEAWKGYELILQVEGVRLRAWVDGRLFFDIEDKDRPLEGGAVALICEEGHMMANEVTVKPVYT
jgi:ADP-ribosylglycohydrolase